MTKEIEQKIGYTFKDKNLLQTAFTHSSFAYVNGLQSNERLEFLGDSVLNFCTTQYLFENFNFSEGESSKIRAYLVSSDYVSQFVQKNNLQNFLKCDNFNPTNSTNVMGDLFEAIVGAMFLDGGLDQCKNFIHSSLSFSADLINSVLSKTRDHKTELQELMQSKNMFFEYVLLEKTGPAHLPKFKVQLNIDNNLFFECEGKSKKEAENLCAKEAMEKLKIS